MSEIADEITPEIAPEDAPETARSRRRRRSQAGGGSGNVVYGLGFIGALVYFWHQAEATDQYVLAVLKALVWPALLVHRAFRALGDT